jgi:hypothetical protein
MFFDRNTISAPLPAIRAKSMAINRRDHLCVVPNFNERRTSLQRPFMFMLGTQNLPLQHIHLALVWPIA